MRVVLADCEVDYVGRLDAHLPMASRLILIKADGSVSIHADDRAYKPLNWMTPPCTLTQTPILDDAAEETGEQLWLVENPKGEQLRITVKNITLDYSADLGVDPGLQKDGVEEHLQQLLAQHVDTFGDGFTLLRREFPTPIGPVDLMVRDPEGTAVAVEVKRRGGIDGVEQLARYLEQLNKDPVIAPVRGIFAAQEIKPQARVLAADRGIRCVILDYDQLRGLKNDDLTLF